MGHRAPRGQTVRNAGPVRVPKRIRAKRKRKIKRYFGLGRREIGAIGAGHKEPPGAYIHMMYLAKLP